MNELRIRRIAVAFGAALLLTSIASGVVLEVPPYPRIQDAIIAANNGDTVSVWGPQPGQPPDPPYIYYENVDFQGKSIFVVNRSFLPGQTGYDSCWDYV